MKRQQFDFAFGALAKLGLTKNVADGLPYEPGYFALVFTFVVLTGCAAGGMHLLHAQAGAYPAYS